MSLGMLGAPLGTKNRPQSRTRQQGSGSSAGEPNNFSGNNSYVDSMMNQYGSGFGNSPIGQSTNRAIATGNTDRGLYDSSIPLHGGQSQQPVARSGNWWGGDSLHGGQTSRPQPGVSSTPQNNLLNQFDAWMKQQQSGLGQNFSTDLAYANTVTGMNQDILQRGLGVDLGLLGERRYRDVDLKREGNALDKWRNDVDLNLIGQQMGLRREQYDSDKAYTAAVQELLNERRGTATERYGVNDAYLQQQAQDNMLQYGFNQRSRDLDEAGNMLQRDVNKRRASSDAAGRGAFSSGGFRDNIGDIAEQFGISQKEAELVFDKANQQVDEQGRSIGNNRDNLGFRRRDEISGFNQEHAGLDKNRRDTSIGFRSDMLGFEGRKADNTHNRKNLELVDKGLDSLAREYGIKEGDLKAGFSEAVDKLGLDLHQTEQQLQRMLDSGNAQLIAQANNFMAQMMAYA